MADTAKPPVKRPWHAVPNDLFLEMVRAGADAACRDLNFQAWSYTATHRTDGWLTTAEVRQFYGWTKGRDALLVAKGFWRRVEGGVEVVGYLDNGLNSTRAEIEVKAVMARSRQAAFRRRKADGAESPGDA